MKSGQILGLANSISHFLFIWGQVKKDSDEDGERLSSVLSLVCAVVQKNCMSKKTNIYKNLTVHISTVSSLVLWEVIR